MNGVDIASLVQDLIWEIKRQVAQLVREGGTREDIESFEAIIARLERQGATVH